MVLGVAVLLSCTSTHDCTLVGCIDAVNVVAPKGFDRVERCTAPSQTVSQETSGDLASAR